MRCDNEQIKSGKIGGDKRAEVRIDFDRNGTPRIETWVGISRRHALWEARGYYRGQARVDFANGEPA